jgi:hypothetical protein
MRALALFLLLRTRQLYMVLQKRETGVISFPTSWPPGRADTKTTYTTMAYAIQHGGGLPQQKPMLFRRRHPGLVSADDKFNSPSGRQRNTDKGSGRS